MAGEQLIKQRKKIDNIDKKLLSLIAERIAVMKEIGKIKQQIKKPIRDIEREKAKIQILVENAPGVIPPAFIKALWNIFFEFAEEIE